MTGAPLAGRAALVTGASRRRGIGFAVARRLAELGANVAIHHHSAHDADQPWGADDLDAVRAGIRAALHPGARFADLSGDLADAAVPSRLVDEARNALGGLDVLVCNQARSGSDGTLLEMTPELLDGHWAVNTRATLLLTRRFAETYAAADTPVDENRLGRVVWMTSGQQDGPMPGEVAYATSKAALAGVTATVARALLDRGMLLTTVNPGPVNTGYLDPETADRPVDDIRAWVAGTPLGRFGTPDDVARLIGWLATDDARWITGRVITSDGGLSLL
ncbi:3-oxoacyl-[acyl-carrier protein] reductase [Diaminobutyricimonas aerilata]|uniref:3-oxoacyl-[acyl-carrier protein] reductase n=1 Tax=Diaminobutyricimonas aerilata TaxID=1162967 RepID=A0A2M9CJA4_9MICO|nr:SDR family oxidoreductase [Diaminobutyricimonas aerilata]PJJ71983.1 3-oxoacyl-[acyl-carrier protein] reductase [Diaminobutyricimonas aerilata]